MFQCHSPKSSHPRPLPQSPKDCSIYLCLFCCLAYRVIVTIFLSKPDFVFFLEPPQFPCPCACHLSPHPIPLGHPSAPALSTLYHASNLDWRSTYDNIHVSMPFSQTIPPSPSPTESKRLFYTSVSLLLSRIQGYRYHLSKFHIYALVYCIGVFLSGLLHSV